MGLLSRPCRKRRPSPREDGGVSGVSSSCGARGVFLPRHDEDLREPLVQAPGKSGLHARGKGERFIALESWEGTRASRRVEEGLLKSFSGCSGKPSFPSTSAGYLRERPGASERQGILWGWRGLSGLRWAWRNGRGPHLEGRQEPQASSPFRTLTAGSLQSWDRRVRPRLV